MIDKVSVQVRIYSQDVQDDNLYTIVHIASWQVLEGLHKSTDVILERLESHNNFD